MSFPTEFWRRSLSLFSEESDQISSGLIKGELIVQKHTKLDFGIWGIAGNRKKHSENNTKLSYFISSSEELYPAQSSDQNGPRNQRNIW